MTLRIGDKGEDVRELQMALREQGFEIVVDGDFGKQTRRAVRDLQEQKGLSVDGIAGTQTLAALGVDLGVFIDFNDEPLDVVGLSPAAHDVIQMYVAVVERGYLNTVESATDAVNQFATVMNHSSTADADPDVLGALISFGLEKSIDDFLKGVGEHIPGVSRAFKIFQEISKELDRADEAQASVRVRDFIVDQREIVAGMRDQFDRIGVQEEVSEAFSLEEGESATDRAVIGGCCRAWSSGGLSAIYATVRTAYLGAMDTITLQWLS